MQVQNNKEEVPFAHYEEKFASLDPQETAARCGVPFENSRFTVTLLGTAYQIAWPKYAISSEDEAAFALRSLPCQTFLLRFLLEGRAAEPSGGYKTFREMPWGEMYIQPYTGRCLTRAAFTFGMRVAKFRAACEKMGAQALSHGDAGFQFTLLPGYDMQIMVWEGDEEFPPNAQILYSANFETGFAAEDRVVAGDILISAIKARM
jgi:hypothetical protein